jgi:polysaccharide biosynthesis protein PslH
MNSGRLKILSIIPYKILPAKLGGEKGIAVFNEYLAQQSTLIGITTKNNDPALAKGYSLLNFLSDKRSRYVDITLSEKVKRIITGEKVTHLITEHPYYAWLAWTVRKSTGVKWVMHSHNIEYMRSKSIGRSWWKALKWYEGWSYRSADKVFFISEDDRKFAIRNLGVVESKSLAITYGIEVSGLPGDVEESKNAIRQKHAIQPGEKILLFNGALYHSTNYDALKIILEEINPLLMAHQAFRYKVIVCGRGLPAFFNDLKDHAGKNIIYAGFVDDINTYFKAADIFLNPILSGGGVKTKAIEAIAMDCTVISTELGAMGIEQEVCGKKLKIITNDNWQQFSDLIISSASTSEDAHTPPEFYQHYYWENIIAKAISFIRS